MLKKALLYMGSILLGLASKPCWELRAMRDRHDDYEEQCRVAHERYMATLNPSFGQRLWAHWKRLFLTVLVNGFIILGPFVGVVLLAAAHESQRHPTLDPLPPIKWDPAVVAKLDAASSTPAAKAMRAKMEAQMAAEKASLAKMAGEKAHRNP